MKVDLSIKWINLFTASSQLFGFVTVKTKVCENDFHKCQIDLFKSTIDFRLIHQSWVLIFCEKSVFFSFQPPKPTNQISPISRVFQKSTVGNLIGWFGKLETKEH